MHTRIAKLQNDRPVRNMPPARWTAMEDTALTQAGELLAAGKLVAFPTETVYGLGANALDAEACRRIYEVKGRPSDNPLIVHIAAIFELYRLAREIPKDAYLLAERFWPGPLTMVLPKAECVPSVTTGGLDTVAIRMPNSAVALEMIERAGVPVAAPSANLSGRPSPTRGDHCVEDLDGKIPLILWGNDCKVGIESTIVDLTGDVPSILRPGFITPTQISEVLGKEVIIDPALLTYDPAHPEAGPKPKAPGMKYRHYAPKAPMTIFQGKDEAVQKAILAAKAEAEAGGKKVGTVFFTDHGFEEAAHNLFAELRQMDADSVDVIFAGALDSGDERGFAVMNRMLKSAGYHVLDV